MKLLVTIAAIALTAGCAVLQEAPMSFIHGAKYSQMPVDQYPLQILSVNKQLHFTRSGVQVAPGMATIVVAPTDGRYASQQKQSSFTLLVEPCTTYWLNSKRESPTANEYTVVVAHKEAVASCDKDKEIAKARA
jgi:hypothetical protein